MFVPPEPIRPSQKILLTLLSTSNIVSFIICTKLLFYPSHYRVHHNSIDAWSKTKDSHCHYFLGHKAIGHYDVTTHQEATVCSATNFPICRPL